MRALLLSVFLFAAAAVAAEEPPPTPPATAPTVPAGEPAPVRGTPTRVESAVPLPVIDVTRAQRMRDAEPATAEPQVTTAASAAAATPVTSRTMSYDVAEERVVNRTRSFRFVSLNEPQRPPAAKPAETTN